METCFGRFKLILPPNWKGPSPQPEGIHSFPCPQAGSACGLALPLLRYFSCYSFTVVGKCILLGLLGTYCGSADFHFLKPSAYLVPLIGVWWEGFLRYWRVLGAKECNRHAGLAACCYESQHLRGRC